MAGEQSGWTLEKSLCVDGLKSQISVGNNKITIIKDNSKRKVEFKTLVPVRTQTSNLLNSLGSIPKCCMSIYLLEQSPILYIQEVICKSQFHLASGEYVPTLELLAWTQYCLALILMDITNIKGLAGKQRSLKNCPHGAPELG